MELTSYYFDTYALYEIIKGNRGYLPYTTGVGLVTARLNLMELYYGLLLKHSKKTAEKYYDAFLEYTIDVDDGIIKEAMNFKYTHRRKDLSYVDCIGYVTAQQRNIRFLTGDRQFKGLPGVEYVK